MFVRAEQSDELKLHIDKLMSDSEAKDRQISDLTTTVDDKVSVL